MARFNRFDLIHLYNEQVHIDGMNHDKYCICCRVIIKRAQIDKMFDQFNSVNKSRKMVKRTLQVIQDGAFKEHLLCAQCVDAGLSVLWESQSMYKIEDVRIAALQVIKKEIDSTFGVNTIESNLFSDNLLNFIQNGRNGTMPDISTFSFPNQTILAIFYRLHNAVLADAARIERNTKNETTNTSPVIKERFANVLESTLWDAVDSILDEEERIKQSGSEAVASEVTAQLPSPSSLPFDDIAIHNVNSSVGNDVNSDVNNGVNNDAIERATARLDDAIEIVNKWIEELNEVSEAIEQSDNRSNRSNRINRINRIN